MSLFLTAGPVCRPVRRKGLEKNRGTVYNIAITRALAESGGPKLRAGGDGFSDGCGGRFPDFTKGRCLR